MKIEIAEYNPHWENDFLSEKEYLSKVLADIHPVIEHIGSTSVKGLGAKPIIDIMIGLKDESELKKIAEKMAETDFTYYKIYDHVMPQRRLFVKLFHEKNLTPPKIYDKDDENILNLGFKSKVNCHIVIINEEFWNRHIAFRNYLRNNDKARDEYYNLKKELAKKEWNDRNDYTDAKTEFIKSIEEKALNQ